MPVTNKEDAFPNSSRGDKSIKKIAHNTWRYTDETGASCIKLHRTTIVRELPDGRVELNSGGYRSMTTKDRMNCNTRGYRVHSGRGSWIVTDGTWQNPGRTAPYYDGIILPDAFNKANAKAVTKAAEEAALIKQINAFVKKVRELETLPLPNAGDCWICGMFKAEKPNSDGTRGGWGHAREKGQSGPTDDAGHLLDHMREVYIHGSLLVNAMRWAGYQDAGIAYYLNQKKGRGDRALLLSALRRYLKRQLGVG